MLRPEWPLTGLGAAASEMVLKQPVPVDLKALGQEVRAALGDYEQEVTSRLRRLDRLPGSAPKDEFATAGAQRGTTSSAAAEDLQRLRERLYEAVLEAVQRNDSATSVTSDGEFAALLDAVSRQCAATHTDRTLQLDFVHPSPSAATDEEPQQGQRSADATLAGVSSSGGPVDGLVAPQLLGEGRNDSGAAAGSKPHVAAAPAQSPAPSGVRPALGSWVKKLSGLKAVMPGVPVRAI